MAKKSAVPKSNKTVETLKHDEATRKNIPTAEYQSVVGKDAQTPIRVAYERRNKDLDPQLVWRGKDEQDWSDLVVHAPPLYIQEKVHPKVLIDDLLRRSEDKNKIADIKMDLFADFNGLPDENAKTEFYQHDAHWANRMILGDSLQVMASLAEREGLRGKVQCIYFDPPYGIKFNSNFQWSTTSRDVKDGNTDHITREPEQVKAFRDTWRDGIHSYLTYLRDRLTVARDLMSESGSVFVQIGDENVHRLRALMDEVFGETNFISQIGFAKTTGSTEDYLGQTTDYILWFGKNKSMLKYRPVFKRKKAGESGGTNYNRIRDIVGNNSSLFETSIRDPKVESGEFRIYSLDNLTSQSAGRDKGEGAASWFGVEINGKVYKPSMSVRWKTNEIGMARLKGAGRLEATSSRLGYVRYLDDFPAVQINNRWEDVGASFMSDKIYVVQTSQTVVQRCLLMSTDP
jgi:adenine-specific DNA-methyltransferase